MAYTTDQKVSDFTEGEVAVADVKAEWITWAQNFIDRHSGLNFEDAQVKTDKFDGDDTPVIFTSRFPLQSVTSLKLDDVAILAADFVFDEDGKIELKDGTFFQGDPDNVEVVYTFGFSAIPATVEALATELVARIALSAKAGQLVDQCRIGDFSAVLKGQRLKEMIDELKAIVGARNEFRFA